MLYVNVGSHTSMVLSNFFMPCWLAHEECCQRALISSTSHVCDLRVAEHQQLYKWMPAADLHTAGCQSPVLPEVELTIPSESVPWYLSPVAAHLKQYGPIQFPNKSNHLLTLTNDYPLIHYPPLLHSFVHLSATSLLQSCCLYTAPTSPVQRCSMLRPRGSPHFR